MPYCELPSGEAQVAGNWPIAKENLRPDKGHTWVSMEVNTPSVESWDDLSAALGGALSQSHPDSGFLIYEHWDNKCLVF